jgi:anti-sigma-K factor RskA
VSGVSNRPAAHDEEFEELAAAHALGALDPADEARFGEHLATCERCRTLVAEYEAIAAALPEALRQLEASPDLRSRVLDAAGRDRPDRGEEPHPPPAEPPARTGQPFRPAPRRASWWALPIAALFAVTIGLAYWNYGLQQQLAEQSALLRSQQQVLDAVAAGGRQWSVAGTPAAPGAGGVLLEDPNDPRPLLLVHGLSELGPRQAYQAWWIANGTPVEAGLLEPGGGSVHMARLDRPLDNAETVAVTVEPAGGSRAPTGPIVAAGQL